MPVRYESKALILFEKATMGSSLLENIGLETSRSTAADSDDYSLENNIAIASSKPILNKVIADFQLSDSKGKLLKSEEFLNPGFLQKISTSPSITIDSIDDTDMFEVVSTSTDPDEAAKDCKYCGRRMY